MHGQGNERRVPGVRSGAALSREGERQMICDCGDPMEMHELENGERTYCHTCECDDFFAATDVELARSEFDEAI